MPVTQTCPQHHHADDVVPKYAIDGLWEFTCDRSDHVPPGPLSWMASNDPAVGAGSSSGRSLSTLTAPLLGCLHPGDPWVEYGVVEARFRDVAPKVFEELVTEHGHIDLNPRTHRGWTASAYLVQALGELRREGRVHRIFGVATGPWKKQPEVSYWALPPTPPTTSRLSLADHTANGEVGLDMTADDSTGGGA